MTKMDRWTCPNDRNLQLRSKLNAGWSCHTKKSLKKDPQLTENELIEIQKVLQRSEMLERNERSRVSRLVERLENMKRNASQSKPLPNCCALCGDFFSLVRSAQNQCSSCLKVLCSKCCIDTQYTPGDEDSWSSATSTTSSTISFLTRTRRNSSYSAGQKNTIYLCRLCSEQREFLKKSGAWFLKKYPSYLTDTDKFSSTSNLSDSTQTNKSTTPTSQSNTGSPNFLTKTNHAINTNNITNSSMKSANLTQSDSSFSFRFWKGKDGLMPNQNNALTAATLSTTSANTNNYNDNDAFSYISNDTDLQQDANSNNDSTSVTTRTASSDNFVKSSPVSINKKQEQFTFTNSPLARNTSNNANTTSQIANTNTSIIPNSAAANLAKSFKSKNNAKLMSSYSSESNNEEEKTDSSMASYNYYSNIIKNLEPKNSSNNNETLSNNKNETIPNGISSSSNNNNNNNNNKKSLSTDRLNNIDTCDDTSSLNRHLIKTLNVNATIDNRDQQQQQHKRNLGSSIANGLINSSLSASASNLDYDPEVASLNQASFKSLNIKKKKATEWCSTQISMDNDDVFSNSIKKSNDTNKASNASNRSQSIKTKGVTSITSLIGNNNNNNTNTSTNLTSTNSSSSSSSTTSKIKLKPKTASVRYGGNMDKLENNLIVASTSSAVASASSLATSLNQLNIND